MYDLLAQQASRMYIASARMNLFGHLYPRATPTAVFEYGLDYAASNAPFRHVANAWLGMCPAAAQLLSVTHPFDIPSTSRMAWARAPQPGTGRPAASDGAASDGAASDGAASDDGLPVAPFDGAPATPIRMSRDRAWPRSSEPRHADVEHALMIGSTALLQEVGK